MPKAPAHRIAERIAQMDGAPVCSTPYCGRPTMAAAGVGLSLDLCKRCVQYAARHGSSWCPSIPAPILKPYVIAAKAWVREHKADLPVVYALLGLRGVMQDASSWGVRPARDIKWGTPQDKARLAFARLAEANVTPERILAVHIGAWACIDDDAYAHRTEEYRLVQSAKALFRLNSGSHFRPSRVSYYPRSSGLVLRVMGRTIEEACGLVAEGALRAVRAAKLERYGPHPSRDPGYKPPWAIQREKALARAKANANEEGERANHVR